MGHAALAQLAESGVELEQLLRQLDVGLEVEAVGPLLVGEDQELEGLGHGKARRSV